MASSTSRRVFEEIGRLPLITYETVLGATPAAFATSVIVTIGSLSPSHRSASTLETVDQVTVRGNAGDRGKCRIGGNPSSKTSNADRLSGTCSVAVQAIEKWILMLYLTGS